MRFEKLSIKLIGVAIGWNENIVFKQDTHSPMLKILKADANLRQSHSRTSLSTVRYVVQIRWRIRICGSQVIGSKFTWSPSKTLSLVTASPFLLLIEGWARYNAVKFLTVCAIWSSSFRKGSVFFSHPSSKWWTGCSREKQPLSLHFRLL